MGLNTTEDAVSASALTDLVRSFGSVFGFKALSTAASFLTLALVGRRLGPAGLGDLSIARTLMLVAAGLFGPALDTAAVRFASQDPRRFSAFFAGVFRVKAGLVLGFAAVGMSLAVPIRDRLFHSEAAVPPSSFLVTAALAGAGGFMLFEYVRVYYQARRRFAVYGGLELAHAVARLVGVGCIAAAGWASTGTFFGLYAAVPCVLAIVGLMAIPRECIVGQDRASGVLTEMFRFVRWVAVACALTSAANGLDMLLIGWFRIPDVPKGDYSAARALAQVGDLAVLSLFSVLLPKASGCVDMRAARLYLKRYMGMAAGVAAALSAMLMPALPLARVVLRVAFGQAFGQAGGCLAVLLFGMLLALAGAPASAMVYARGRPRTIALLEGLKLALIYGVALYAAPRYGIMGIAWTLAAAKGTISLLTCVAALSAVNRGCEDRAEQESWVQHDRHHT